MTGLTCCKKADETVDTCHDGVRNQIETGIDCGGPCIACPTCTDGIKNQNERGIDCGGPLCAPCASCSNGIQDNDETGVDCGGTICSPCPSCSDGVANQGETGIDCGGPCAPCPEFVDVFVGDYVVSGTRTHWFMSTGSTDTITNYTIHITKFDATTIVYNNTNLPYYAPYSQAGYQCFLQPQPGGYIRVDFSKTDTQSISISTQSGGMSGGDYSSYSGRKIH